MHVIKSSRKTKTGQEGFTLISVMVGLGISSVVAAAFSGIMTNGMRTQRSLELRGSLEATRMMIMRTMDCTQTLPTDHALCSSATPYYLAVANQTGAVVVANGGASGTKVGDWWVRSSCINNALVFETARFTPSGSFAVDPANGHSLSWTNLFGQLPSLCAI